MDQDVEGLARAAVAHREAGHGVVEAVALLVDEHPVLRETPFRLFRVIRSAFSLSIPEAKSIVSWVQGDVSRELLAEWLHEHE
jgi:hypothetical protein